MSTQIRNSGGGGRNKNKANHTGGGGGNEATAQSNANNKKTDAKTEKEKVQPKPTAEQLRIAQITNNTSEDPQMREKVATLIEMTQRSEEEVCCALNECDNNLERAVVFLLETLPVGAFETSSKKKKNKAANVTQDIGGGDGEWASDSNANADKREKSRNRTSNRGGRGGTDSRGWRGREARENERNLRESRGGGGGGGGDREERNNESYRGPRGGRGGRGYAGRGGRGGGRMGGGRGPRGERGGFGSRHANEEHQEVEVWDNSFAQNAEKQQQQPHQQQDDAWGDWDNEEYVGSLKDSKVFTTSNLQNQTAASVLSGAVGSSELSAPPGLEHHLATSVIGGGGGSNNSATSSSQTQGSHLNTLVGNTVGASGILNDSGDANASGNNVVGGAQTTTTMMQYSAAVSSSQLPQQQQQQQQQQQSSANSVGGVVTGGTQTQSYVNAVDSFTNAATAAANLVQQVQQQQAQLKSASATLSAEQSQYFNSLASQGATSANSVQQQQQQPMATYAQSAAAMNYPQTFANVFGSGTATDQSQQQPQVRRARAKLPPPSKIPSSAVEMPGDTLNNVGYLDVQFGGLDFGNEESFDTLSEKFAAGVTIDGQQSQEEVANDYQTKAAVQQQAALTSGLQNSQMAESISNATYSQRGASQQQQVQVVSSSTTGSALDQLKNDPYNQTNTGSNVAYQNTYQGTGAAKTASNAYQHATGQGYNSASYANVQSSVGANSYQPQSYGVYQPSSYQQQHPQQQQTGTQNIATSAVVSNNGSIVAQSSSVSGSSTTQNIPVGNSSANSNSNSGYLSSGYGSQQSAYQSSQSVYGNSGLSSNTGYAGSASTSASQYSNFSTSAKLKETSTTSSTTHYDSVSSSNAGTGNSTSVSSANVNSSGVSANNNSSSTGGVSNSGSNGTSTVSSSVVAGSQTNNNGSVVSVAAAGVSTSSNKNNSNTGGVGVGGSSSSAAMSGSGSGAGGAGGMVPTNIQMVSQYIQAGMPYYQQPLYSYEDLQMMQQRVQHVPGYYDLNYTPTSLGAGRDNLGSVAYSTMTDGRFTRTDNNSSPVSNVSSTMSQQAGSGGPMLNVPYAAYFYGGVPGGFQYGTPAIYPQQIPAANTPSGQFPKPSYNTGYSSSSYDTLSQASQDYTKGSYQSNVNQQTKSQNVTNQGQAGTGSEVSSMYGKGHVALNKVNSYEKQNFHSGTPPPFNTQTAGGTSAQPYGMYLPMPATGHHNMIHQPMHQMDGRIHNSSRRDSNNSQRQQTSSQSKSSNKQGYGPSYWTGQN